MNQTELHNARLEEEIRLLKAQLEHAAEINETLTGMNDSAFRAIFNHSADGMMLIDSKGIIREWNSGFERIMGLDKEAVANKISLWELLELIFPFDRQTVEEFEEMKSQLKDFVANMRERSLVRHMKHCKTGENRILEVVYFPVVMPDEIMLGGIGRDVTVEIKYRERQDILIKVLEIMQSAEDLSKAMNKMLAETGKFAEVSRVYVFEKSDDGSTVRCTNEWCNSGISRIKDHFQNTPIKGLQPWFDIFDDGKIINTSDINTLNSTIVEKHNRFGAISFLDFPLTANGVHYGFVGFDECVGVRTWDENEVELLKSVSQIISATRHRFRTEQKLLMEHDRLRAIGDNFPDGSLFRFEINPQNMKEMCFSYLSATWEKVMGISVEESEADVSKVFDSILPEFIELHAEEIVRCTTSLHHFLFEYQKWHKGNEIRWILSSSYPRKISENKVVYDGFVLDITDRKIAEQQLLTERNRLKAIGNNLPNGSIFRWEMNTITNEMRYVYLSETWTKITGLDVQQSLDNVPYSLSTIFPEDRQLLMDKISNSQKTLENYSVEVRIIHLSGEIRWLLITAQPHRAGKNLLVYDGFILDVTSRKNIENELAKYRENLEFLVKKRTEELEASGKELQATNEELSATNEELDRYKTQLEEIVLQKTAEVINRQEDLEKLSRRQEILIKVLHIVQSAKDLPQAMSDSLAEIGNYTGVSRVYVFEKSDNETVINCTFEWCNSGISSIIGKFQNVPIMYFQPWFDVFYDDKTINTSDNHALNPRIIESHHRYGVKSFLDFPLTSNGVHYGFVGFDECINDRVWDENEIELLEDLSQILSTTRRRFRAELELVNERDRIQAIGDNFPDGSLFRLEINPQNMNEMCLTYMSAKWEEVMGTTIEETKADIHKWLDTILPEFKERMMEEVSRSIASLQHFTFEYQKWHKDSEIRWILASSYPRKISENKIIFDGFVLDITDRKNIEIDLEKLSSRQAILIKVLQIVQSTKDLPFAINESLAEIGKYSGVSRVHVFEINENKTTISNTFEWCDDGLEPNIDSLQDIPIEVTKPWFEQFDIGKYVVASDIHTLAPELSGILVAHSVKSVVVFPLFAGGEYNGFVTFDENITYREWDENEVNLLKSLSQIISTTRFRYQAEQELRLERDRIQSIGDNFPGGALFRWEVDRKTNDMGFTYLSKTWTDITGLDVQKSLDDVSYSLSTVLPEDADILLKSINGYTGDIIIPETFESTSAEIRLSHPSNKILWLQIVSHPYIVTESIIIYDGFILDITTRKEAELELEKYRENLEFIVKERTEELQAINEELQAINEELHKYQTSLEDIVAEKTAEVIARQEDLEKLNRRQAILIKVLQIVQSAENLTDAINQSIAEIGRYAGVSRVHVFEKSHDETTISNTFGWCNYGIKEVIDFLQNIPIEKTKSFFDMFDAGIYACHTDDPMIAPELSEMLVFCNVKSFTVFPLSSGGENYGFVVFDECNALREWDENEVELLKSLSQILSGVKSRLQAETALRKSHHTMRTVLDNLPISIFVTDIDTLDILFANRNIKNLFGIEDLEGKKCWQTFQIGQKEACDFCPRKKLLDSKHQPTGVFHWEYFNEVFKHHLSLDALAVEWIDERLAHMEVVVDITDRKLMEIELIHAKEKAEESDMLKSAFLANMSHEIRTPLNAIVGFLKIITDGNLTPKREKDYFNIINKSASQLTKLVDDILDVSKIESKQLNIFPVPVNINQLMTEIQIYFESFLQNNNKEHIILILDDSGFIDNCTTLVDSIRLHQVLNNLIGNAVKFTKKGYIRFGYRLSAPDKLEFVVEDTGIGMALEKYEVVFERFRKIGNHFFEGVGLGLNISHSLIQMMGGDIWLESKEGEGSTFYFTITYQPVIQDN